MKKISMRLKSQTKRQELNKKKQLSKNTLFFSKLKKNKLGRFFISLNKKETLLWLMLLVMFIVFFANFSVHRVTGISMKPTLQNNDFILISKKKHPSRYAIVTFFSDSEKTESYIKRIIGMPGDRIRTHEGHLYLLPKENDINSSISLIKDIPDGTIRIAVTDDIFQELSYYERIPANYYFVEGDNRLHSEDSRTLGLISKEQIEGVVCARYLPFSRMGTVN